MGNVLRATWERGWSFIKRAGTVILASSIILWFLQGFGWENGSFGMVADMNNSVLASIGTAIAFGSGPWASAPGGSPCRCSPDSSPRRNVVATLAVLYGYAGELSDNGDEMWGLLAASGDLTPPSPPTPS